jgi:hypothetical protein
LLKGLRADAAAVIFVPSRRGEQEKWNAWLASGQFSSLASNSILVLTQMEWRGESARKPGQRYELMVNVEAPTFRDYVHRFGALRREYNAPSRSRCVTFVAPGDRESARYLVRALIGEGKLRRNIPRPLLRAAE